MSGLMSSRATIKLLQLPYGERKGQSSLSSMHCILQEPIFNSSEAVLENVSPDSPTDSPNFDLLEHFMNLGSTLQYLPWMLTPTPRRIAKVSHYQKCFLQPSCFHHFSAKPTVLSLQCSIYSANHQGRGLRCTMISAGQGAVSDRACVPER